VTLDALRRRLADDGVLMLALRVRPSAAEDALGDVLADGSLKVSVAAPPAGGKANAALRALLAEAFGVPLACVALRTGLAGRRKTARITRPPRR